MKFSLRTLFIAILVTAVAIAILSELLRSPPRELTIDHNQIILWVHEIDGTAQTYQTDGTAKNSVVNGWHRSFTTYSNNVEGMKIIDGLCRRIETLAVECDCKAKLNSIDNLTREVFISNGVTDFRLQLKAIRFDENQLDVNHQDPNKYTTRFRISKTLDIK